MKILIVTIIPVLLSTTIYNISGVIDQGIFKKIALLQGYSESEIHLWWGVFSGKYKLMINVPISIASALAASSVPAITASYAEHDMGTVRNEVSAAMRFVMIVSLPCTVGLAVLATPIFAVLFPGTRDTVSLASQMMWIGAVAVVFYSISTLSNGLLQGIDRMKIPVINAVIALVLHAIVLILLMLVFRLHIFAVVIANCLFALIMCFLNARALSRHSGHQQEMARTFLIPAVCSLFMGLVTFLVYQGVYALSKSMIVGLVVSICVAVIVYAVLMLLLHGLTEREILRFPKGASLVRMAKKLHLLK